MESASLFSDPPPAGRTARHSALVRQELEGARRYVPMPQEAAQVMVLGVMRPAFPKEARHAAEVRHELEAGSR